MKSKIYPLLLVLCTTLPTTCAKQTPIPQTGAKKHMSINQSNIGKTITLEGRAVDSKSGAMLIGEGWSLYMFGMDSWPDGYWTMQNQGRKVRVTGTLGDDNSLPVFVQKKGEPIKTGMPVPEGTDLKKAGHRYTLKDAKWELIE